MTITSCFYMREGRAGTFEKYGQRTATEMYLIETDDEWMGPAQIWDAGQALSRTTTQAPLPALQTTYKEYDGATLTTTDTGIYMMKMTIRQDSGSAKRWIATANYRPLRSGEDANGEVATPLDLPIKYWLEFASSSEVVREAVNVETLGPNNERGSELGPIQNGALQDYDEPLERLRHRTYLVADRPVANLTALLAINEQYDGTENSDNFYGYPPGHARFAGVSSSQELELNGIKYYLATIRVEMSRERFEHKIVNRGYKYYKTVFDALQGELTDTTGSEPELIDQRGVLIPKGEKGDTITYRDLTPKPYAGLGI